MTDLSAKLLTAGFTNTVTQDADTKLITIAITAGGNLNFVRHTTPYKNQVYRYFGLSSANSIFTTAGTSFTSDEFPNVRVSSAIQVHMSNFTTNGLEMDSYYISVPLDQVDFAIINWQN